MPPTAALSTHAAFSEACHRLVAAYSLGRPRDTADEDRTAVLGPERANSGWVWQEHPRHRGLGYLARSRTIRRRHLRCSKTFSEAVDGSRDETPANDALEGEGEGDDDASGDVLHDEAGDDDPAALTTPTEASATAAGEKDELLISVTHHIVFSASFRCPQLLLSAHSFATSRPLPLPALIASNLLLTTSATPLPPIDDEDATSLPLPPPPTADDEDAAASFPLLSLAEHPSTGEVCWAVHPCRLREGVDEVLGSGDGGEGGGKGEGERGMKWLEGWLMLVGGVVDLRLD